MMAPSRLRLTGSNRLVYTVPQAGRLLGLGRNAAYDAARRGEIPTIKLGRLLRVPKAALHKLVGIEPAYSRTVGEADDTADNTDEDSAESDDDEAVVQITLCRGQYRAKILWLGPAPDQQDADHSANCGDPGDVGEDHPASHQGEKAPGASIRTAGAHRRCRYRSAARRHTDFLMPGAGTYAVVSTTVS
jgi:excisionase family DNA binding protein